MVMKTAQLDGYAETAGGTSSPPPACVQGLADLNTGIKEGSNSDWRGLLAKGQRHWSTSEHCRRNPYSGLEDRPAYRRFLCNLFYSGSAKI